MNGDEITGAVITLVLEEVGCEAGCGEGDCGGGCEQGLTVVAAIAVVAVVAVVVVVVNQTGDDPDDDAPGVTETDDVGNYEFSDLRSGRFIILVEAEGYVETNFVLRFVNLGVNDDQLVIPEKTVLSEAYPNPFNSTTKFTYDLPIATNVRVSLYNTTGTLVKLLVDRQHSAGIHQLILNGADLSAGAYILRLQAANVFQSQSIVFLK